MCESGKRSSVHEYVYGFKGIKVLLWSHSPPSIDVHGISMISFACRDGSFYTLLYELDSGDYSNYSYHTGVKGIIVPWSHSPPSIDLHGVSVILSVAC